MLPKQHAAYGAVAALAMAPWLRRRSLTVWAASVLIDVDHYLWYVVQRGDWSLPRAYHFFRHQRDTQLRRPGADLSDARPFHGPWPVTALALAAWRLPILRPILFGVLVHSLLDAYSEHRLNALLPLRLRAMQ